MLVIFLDVEHNGTGQLDLCEQIEISQDEEDLALGFELRDHELLVGQQVVVLLVRFVLFVGDVSSLL